jgi:hypothetical protein
MLREAGDDAVSGEARGTAGHEPHGGLAHSDRALGYEITASRIGYRC